MITHWNLILFIVLSAGAVAASLHSLRTHQVYGFFRFFAFETLVLLIIWNIPHWFHDPLSIHQIVSWTFLVASTVLGIHGIYLLKTIGKAQKRFIEDTQTIVEIGIYRYIRHPVYASLILLGWGVFFKGVDLPGGVLVLATTAFLFATARYEENFNVYQFGAVYSDYMKETKMFIPFLL